MRDFAKVSPQIWINETGRELRRLGVYAQLIAHYLNTNPHAHMMGIYYLPVAFIAHETGISPETVIDSLCKLSEINYCTYDQNSEYIWVHDMAFDQISSSLKFNDNRVKAINDAFYGLPELPFLQEFLEKYGEVFHIRHINNQKDTSLEETSKPLASNEKEKEEEKNKEKNKEKNNDNDFKDQAINILNFFNETTKTTYPPEDINLKFIIEKLTSGYSEKQCFHVITKKHRDWIKDKKMRDFIKLEIIFGQKFAKYIGELRQPQPRNK